MKYVTIGVAGHVDHGKTSLVRTLTGIDTDRHPEEKRRGLSLETGIASWLRPDGTTAAFVDVPGHRDFLKNTVRGLHGVDLAVLLVAADDGVMPQTREHLDILSFFQVRSGVVVLSKTDCVDADTLELAELEIMELAAGTFLEGQPILRFSAVDGTGRDEVSRALDLAISMCPGRSTEGAFRLWIDQIRSFSGIGTVVSGTVLSGTVRAGDELLVLPDGIRTRIRSLEQHGRPIDGAVAGQRIGINLHRIGIDKLRRGMSLSPPGHCAPMLRCNALLRGALHSREQIKDGQKVKIYLGGSVHIARIKLIGASSADETAGVLVQMWFREKIAVLAGDPFVISPMNRNTIIAGGRVLELGREKVRASNTASILERLRALAADDFASYFDVFCRMYPGTPVEPERLRSETAWEENRIMEFITSGLHNGALVQVAPGRIVRRIDLEGYAERFVEIVETVFEAHPARESMPVAEIVHQCKPVCDEQVAVRVVDDLCSEGRLVKGQGGVRPAGFSQRLPGDLTRAAALLNRFVEGQGWRPFSVGFFMKTVAEPIPQRRVERTLDYFCKTGEMIRLKNDRYLSDAAVSEIKYKIRLWIAENGAFHLRDCKDALDFNRGIGLPVLEYLDSVGFTVQEGEGRVLNGNCS